MKDRRLLIFLLLVVALLVGGCGLWVWQAKRQYALNRQLIAALAHNDPRQQLELINVGADPNTRFDPPPAPTFTLLLKHLLRQSSPLNDSPTALMLACGEWYDLRTGREIAAYEPAENLPLLQAMLAHGANVRARAKGGNTALHSAIYRRRVQTAELLLQHGANVNAKDAGGQTPLMEAATTTTEVTRWLLSHGANPNAQNVSGNTALHFALMFATAAAPGDAPHSALLYARSAGIIRELVTHGANPDLCNRQGQSARILAQNKHRSDLVALL